MGVLPFGLRKLAARDRRLTSADVAAARLITAGLAAATALVARRRDVP